MAEFDNGLQAEEIQGLRCALPEMGGRGGAESEAKELGAIARTGIQRPRKCALDIFIAKDLDSGTVLHVLSVLPVCSLVLVVYSE